MEYENLGHYSMRKFTITSSEVSSLALFTAYNPNCSFSERRRIFKNRETNYPTSHPHLPPSKSSEIPSELPLRAQMAFIFSNL